MTLFFSCANTSIATVIPAMDHIDSVLINVIVTGTDQKEIKLLASIMAALSIGKHTLNHYYDKTDLSEVFCIAMGKYLSFILSFDMLMYFFVVLHPHHKLQYFKNAGWTQEWIDTAQGIVETQFKHAYASRDVEEDDTPDKKVHWIVTEVG